MTSDIRGPFLERDVEGQEVKLPTEECLLPATLMTHSFHVSTFVLHGSSQPCLHSSVLRVLQLCATPEGAKSKPSLLQSSAAPILP